MTNWTRQRTAPVIVVRRRGWTRVLTLDRCRRLAALLLILAVAIVWIERRPIATHFLKGEDSSSASVTMTYHLDRIGLLS